MAPSSVTGASWIIRNTRGKVLFHSRRSFSGVVSKAHASLLALSWASTAVQDLKLKDIVFEFSSQEAVNALNNPVEFSSYYYMCYDVFKNIYSVPKSSLSLVSDTCNQAAAAIADSVTRDHRVQSYVAAGGPRRLSDLLIREVSTC